MKIKYLLLALLCVSFVFAQQKDKKGVKDSKETIQLKKYPQMLNQVLPDYPQVLKLAGIQGKVYVETTIDESGNVVSTKVLKSDHEALSAPAIEAIKKTKFSPAVSKEDKKVKATVVIPFKFALEGEDLKQLEKAKKEAKNSEKEGVKNIGPGVMPPTKDDDVDPDIDAFVKFEKSPKAINLAKPEYPEEAKKNKITGKVFVKVLIDKGGIPKKAIVIKSDNELLNQPSVDAALKTTFSPALQKGKPISVWVVLPYKYTLEGKKSEETPKAK